MLLPEHGAAAQALALLALPLLGSSLALAATTTASAAIRWSVFQALAVAGVGATIATLRPSWDQLAAAVLALPVNAAALPLLLHSIETRRSRDAADAAPYSARDSRLTGALAAGLIAAALLLVRPVNLAGTAVAGPLLPTTVALWLVGALVVVFGASTAIRVCGLLSVANGVLLLGLATGSGLCPIVGLGYCLDALASALVLSDLMLLGPATPAATIPGP